jgi:hypothetical protein
MERQTCLVVPRRLRTRGLDHADRLILWNGLKSVRPVGRVGERQTNVHSTEIPSDSCAPNFESKLRVHSSFD